ncbi:MAG: hypothetical protein K8R90_00580 [Candidatus Cloacimonetes bacterium]|nr:hypothetical protein [Candidatus Cloacimonadota bacterium]
MTLKKLLLAVLLSFAFMNAYGVLETTFIKSEENYENPLLPKVFPGVEVKLLTYTTTEISFSPPRLAIVGYYNGESYSMLAHWNQLKAILELPQTATVEEELLLYGQILNVKKTYGNIYLHFSDPFEFQVESVRHDSIMIVSSGIAHHYHSDGSVTDEPSTTYYPYNYTIVSAHIRDGIVEKRDTLHIFYEDGQIIRKKGKGGGA